MTQGPESCDKPPARDNKQRQTNPETLPGLAGLQAVRPRQEGGHGNTVAPANTAPSPAPRWAPAGGHSHLGPTWQCPVPGMLLEGTCTPAPVAPLQPCPHQWTPAPHGTAATSLPASPAQHTSAPLPGSHRAQPHRLQPSRGDLGWEFGYSPGSSCKRRGWAAWAAPLPPHVSQPHCFEEATYGLLTRESCLPAAQCVAPGWPPRKTLG